MRHFQRSEQGLLEIFPEKKQVAAISLGILNDQTFLDLDYAEDSQADVDMNVIMTNNYEIIKLQDTAEKAPLSGDKWKLMPDLAESDLKNHLAKQLKVLGRKIN